MNDYQLEDTVYLPFTTRAFATGVPTALVSGEVQIYEDASITQITASETLTVSLDAVAGFNMVAVAATAANGFGVGQSYTAILSAGTVGGVSVVGEVIGHFTIDKSAAAKDLANATDGLTALKAILDTSGVLLKNTTHTGAIIPTVSTLSGHTAQTGDTYALANGATGFAAIAGYIDAEISTIIGYLDTEIAALVAACVTNAAGVDIAADIIALKTVADAIRAVSDVIPDAGALTTIQNDLNDIQTRLPAALTTGTADSGTTLTCVDAARTEADIDYWKGCWIRFNSGTIAGQVRLITGFTPIDDTITFAPATTQAVGTNTYEILPAAYVERVLSVTTNDDMRGTDGANTTAPDNAGITGIQNDLSNATDGLGALKTLIDTVNTDLSNGTDGLGALKALIDAISTTIGAAGAGLTGITTVGAIGTGGIASTSFAAGAVDSAAVASDIVTEIRNAVTDDIVETQGSITLQQALSIILAVCAGVTADSGATLKSPNGVSIRVAATVNGSQERTAMTLTPSS